MGNYGIFVRKIAVGILAVQTLLLRRRQKERAPRMLR